MVIGNGMLAQRFASEFANSSHTLVFASGVSNSKMYNPASFLREERLLTESIRNYSSMRIVYFSTCGIYDPSLEETPYIIHKQKMEQLVSKLATSYLICRTTNIVGNKGNSNTIINYLIERIQSGAPFECWDKAVRNILDVDDFYRAVKLIIQRLRPSENMTVNVFNPLYYNIKDIVCIIEKHYSRHANYSIVDKGAGFYIPDTYGLESLYAELGIFFTDEYIAKVLDKYHPVSYQQNVNMANCGSK